MFNKNIKLTAVHKVIIQTGDTEKATEQPVTSNNEPAKDTHKDTAYICRLMGNSW